MISLRPAVVIAVVGVLGLPVEGDAVAVAGGDVAVEAVGGDVQLAAVEPLRVRRVRPVEHVVPRLDPLELLGPARPPGLAIRRGLLVDAGVGDVRVRGELVGRGKGLLGLHEHVELGDLDLSRPLPRARRSRPTRPLLPSLSAILCVHAYPGTCAATHQVPYALSGVREEQGLTPSYHSGRPRRGARLPRGSRRRSRGSTRRVAGRGARLLDARAHGDRDPRRRAAERRRAGGPARRP